jgi:hypothetical protein
MSEETHAQDLILSRIARLEAQNRAWKRGALAGLVAVAALGLLAVTSVGPLEAGLMGQTSQTSQTSQTGQTQRKPAPRAATPRSTAPAPAPAAPAMPKNIEAESFILKDANGKVRAELSMGGTGPSLKFRDQAGMALVTLSLNDSAPGGPFLLLSDPQHHAGLSMSVLEGAGSQLSLTGERADVQAHIAVAPEGTSLALSDGEGFTANLGSGMQPTKNGQVKKTTAASITLLNKDRKLLWSAP